MAFKIQRPQQTRQSRFRSTMSSIRRTTLRVKFEGRRTCKTDPNSPSRNRIKSQQTLPPRANDCPVYFSFGALSNNICVPQNTIVCNAAENNGHTYGQTNEMSVLLHSQKAGARVQPAVACLCRRPDCHKRHSGRVVEVCWHGRPGAHNTGHIVVTRHQHSRPSAVIKGKNHK